MVISKRIRLIGKTITPIIVPKPYFYIKGCKVSITREPKENEKGYLPYPRRMHYGKLVKGLRKAPTIKNCYQGFLVVDFPGNNKQTEKRLQWFLSLRGLGKHQNNGMGKIQWLERRVVTPKKRTPRRKKLVIRKGLGHHPKPLQTAIKALLLHDFVHTEKHSSKIYHEVEITNQFIREACKNHHENGSKQNNTNWLIPIIKKYDGLASFLNRRIPRKEEKRYDFENGEIDCKAVALEISEKQNNVYSLYNYIYYNKTLARFYETITYANNKLRTHLLLAVNLLISDFKKGKLTLENNKLVIVSQPTKDKGETEKPISKSKVLKRIYTSKKGAEKNISALQERSAKDENRPLLAEKNHLRCDN